MTESEAIKELHAIRPRGSIIPQKRAEAIDVAIKALRQVEKLRKLMKITAEMSDLISRSELLKAMDTWDKFGYDEHNRLIKIDRTDEEYVPYVHYEDMVKCVNGMPTAYLVDKVVDDVRCRCYEIGLDESQTEIIVSEIVKYEGSVKE